MELNCPLPLGQYEQVLMAHGGGGQLMQQLLDRLVQPLFDNPQLAARHDSAVLDCGDQRLAFTTDSYVVKPLFFPGGDIGKLAVCGTLNDLAMAGARPLCLSASLIIEEGLPVDDLRRVLESMAATARTAGVAIVTGDTKVVERGRGDVQSACDILGFDPLYVANEGRLAAFVPAEQAEQALTVLHQHPLGASAALIGSVTSPTLSLAPVHLRTAYGTERILMRLSGEQLPRIC